MICHIFDFFFFQLKTLVILQRKLNKYIASFDYRNLKNTSTRTYIGSPKLVT